MFFEHQEVPETRLERYVIIACSGAILLLGYLLIRSALGDLDRPHLVEFIGLLLLLVLALYLGLLFFQLATVRYAIGPGAFQVQQGWHRIAFDLTREVRLYRWRNRWGWGDGALQDLGLEGIDLFPPLSLLRQGTVWVVTGLDESGVPHAVALRPSSQLLLLLRERALPRWEEDHG